VERFNAAAPKSCVINNYIGTVVVSCPNRRLIATTFDFAVQTEGMLLMLIRHGPQSVCQLVSAVSSMAKAQQNVED